MKFAAIVTRTLKPGKTYDDYRKAWFHTNGFGVPTEMYTVINAFNPRELISIGILEVQDLKELFNALEIDVTDRLANQLDEVIESKIIRHFGLISAIDDFSPAGKLEYVPAQVDGEITDYEQIALHLETIASEIRKASVKRDALKKEPCHFQNLTLQDAETLADYFKKLGWHKPLSGLLTYLEEAELGLRKNIVSKNSAGQILGYVTVLWESDHPYFQERKIPEIKDLNVLPEFQKQGFGRALLRAAEQEIYKKLGPDQTIGIGVGILKDYGPAQRLYIQEGYVPNAEGVMVNHQNLNYGYTGSVDDDWVLWMVKKSQKGTK